MCDYQRNLRPCFVSLLLLRAKHQKKLTLDVLQLRREKKKEGNKNMFSVWKTFLECYKQHKPGAMCYYFFFLNARDVYRYSPFNRQHTATGSGAKVLL